MSLQNHIKQYKPLNQAQMNEFIELLITNQLEIDTKRELLEAFSEREPSQAELTYMSKV